MAILSKRDLPFLAFSMITLGLRAVPTRLRLQWCNVASKQLGKLWYRLDRTDAALARNNLQCILGERFSASQVAAIAETLYQNVAFSKLVNDLLPGLSLQDINQYLVLEGKEHLDQALSDGRGAILLATHFGLHGYSMMAMLRHMGYDFASVVSDEIEPGDSWLYERLVLPIRRSAEDRLQFEMLKPNGLPQMKLIETLRQNRPLIIFGDVLEETMLQMVPPHVVPVPFLGHSLLLKTGPFRLARGVKSPVLPVFIVPRGEGFALVIEPPLLSANDGSINGLIADLAAFTNRFESHLLRYPALWAHWRHASLLELMQPDKAPAFAPRPYLTQLVSN